MQYVPTVLLTALIGQANSTGKQMQGLLKTNLVMGVDMCCPFLDNTLHFIRQKWVALTWPSPHADAKIQALWEKKKTYEIIEKRPWLSFPSYATFS
jgi:hypothetical protein